MGKHKELVASFEHMGNDVWFVDTAWALEAEATEIVRCRDCMWYAHLRMMCRRGDFTVIDSDNFCSWGERNDV